MTLWKGKVKSLSWYVIRKDGKYSNDKKEELKTVIELIPIYKGARRNYTDTTIYI